MKTYVVDLHYTSIRSSIQWYGYNYSSIKHNIECTLYCIFNTENFHTISNLIEEEFGVESIISKELAICKLTEEQISYLLLRYS